MIEHFKNPSKVRPGSSMPAILLNDSQLNALAAFLLRLNPRNESVVDSAPDFAVRGAMVYQANGCNGCHKVNGAGSLVGPPLNGLMKRHDRSWVIAHFGDPSKLTPGSEMPPYKFSPTDADNLTTYLLTLPDQP
jgi:ubiquinol-cytochrome c reductase cytochrome b subunit